MENHHKKADLQRCRSLPSFVRRTDGHILDLKHKLRPNPLFDFKERGIRHDLSRATGSLQGRAKKRKQIKSISGMRQKWASEKEQVRNLDNIKKISFIIPNEWGQYLYRILSPIKDIVDGTWEVYGTWEVVDLQAWKNINGEMVDLFDSDYFSNQDFFSLLESRMYYIVSGIFSLKSSIENKKDNLNTPYLEVIVTDSVYVDISSVDDKIISALYTNAVNQGFENIEMDG